VHELALFAGAGGGILGGKLFGWLTECRFNLKNI
jgi:DNA (cytosine-5)-methyltransferase 1